MRRAILACSLLAAAFGFSAGPALLADLEKTHTLVPFDNRGVGLSTDTVENNTTIPQMADDAAARRPALWQV